MARLITCPQGHQWEVAEGPGTDVPTLPCPVCGAGGGSVAGTPPALALDELPPLPRPLPRTAASTSSLAPAARTTVAGYEILGELGRGGMGVVYKARQINLNRVVALKMLLAGMHAGAQELARFRAEAETLARLQHPNIVHIYDIGEQDGCTYLALEYVDGPNLAQQLAGRPQPARDSAQLVETLARVIHAAHQRGIVHRDLKPANILLQKETTIHTNHTNENQSDKPSSLHSCNSCDSWLDCFPKITDFGLAKRSDALGLTQSGAVLGTPSYMAPEQAAGESHNIGPATDVYALGAILYEMLTGRPPFAGATPLETVRQVVSVEPVPPSRLGIQTPPELETICLRCLQKDPRRRYASALELADDLCRFREDKTLVIAPGGPRPPAAPRAKGRLRALAAAALTVAVGVLIWSLTPYWPGRQAPELGGPAVAESNSGPADPGPAKENNEKADPAPPAKNKPRPAGKLTWQTLQILTAEKNEAFQRISFPTRKVGYAASDRAIYKTEDGGTTWKPVLQAAFLKSRSGLLRFQDARTGWISCGSRLYATADGGGSWTPVDIGLRVFDLAIGSDGWLLASGLFEPSGYPEGILQKRGPRAAWEDLEFARRAKVPGRIGWPRVIVTAGPQTAFIGCNDQFVSKSCVIRTRDGGKTWKTVFTTDKARLTGIHFADAKHGWLAGGKSLWVTEDGADTWKSQLNPEEASVGGLSFDPQGSTFGIAPLHTNGHKILMTTNGKEWCALELDLKAPIVDAAVVDGGCAFVLGRDGRIVRCIDPASNPGSKSLCAKRSDRLPFQGV